MKIEGEHEFPRETLLIAFDLFIEAFCAHAIEQGEVAVDENAAASHQQDAGFDVEVYGLICCHAVLLQRGEHSSSGHCFGKRS